MGRLSEWIGHVTGLPGLAIGYEATVVGLPPLEPQASNNAPPAGAARARKAERFSNERRLKRVDAGSLSRGESCVTGRHLRSLLRRHCRRRMAPQVTVRPLRFGAALHRLNSQSTSHAPGEWSRSWPSVPLPPKTFSPGSTR